MTSAPRSASSIVAYGPASITPTSRMRTPARGPVICALDCSRKGSPHLRRELRNNLPRAVFRGNQLVAVLADRQQTHRQVGDACVGEAAEPRENRFLVAGRGQVADIAGVATIEQP